MANRKRGTSPRYNKDARLVNRYNYSSVAYDYAAEEEIARPKRRPKRRRKVKNRIKYVKAIYSGPKIKLSTYASIVIVFVCSFLCLLAVSNVSDQQRVNAILTGELKTLQDKTNEMMVEVAESMDLEQIEQIARTKLGMSEPEAHQIKYVPIQKQNYTVYHFESDNELVTSAENTTFTLSDLKKLIFKE